jgi:hypothetical protein
MNNIKLINQINQLLHNKGVKQETRIDLLIELLENNKKKDTCDDCELMKKYDDILSIINSFDYSNKDLIQELFMSLCSKLTKYNLDQFYTPLTISQFINVLMLFGDEYNAIDPAGGTGDLLLYYKGHKTIWDIDENALKLCKFNFELNKQNDYELVCKNSLLNFDDDQCKYSYVTINPPFGSSTVVTERNILDKFELGKNKKKQEIGILFVELGLKLLKNNGIMFIILPSGYMGNGNKTCSELRNLILKNRVIASIELPRNTFKRSGTGVNTYLLIVQKLDLVAIKRKPYDIFISGLDNIGYNLTKKDTPLKYKIVGATGEQLCDDNGNPILDNDFEEVYKKISYYCYKNKLKEFNLHNECVSDCDGGYECPIETISTSKLSDGILDIKRYRQNYLNILQNLQHLKSKKVCDFSKIITDVAKIVKTEKYKYIDIGEISSPLHSYKELFGWELPSRAKYSVKKYDILVSKLEGTMSYCVILDDNDNYIATNGLTVIRPNNMDSLYILLTNIMTKTFVEQHTAYLTGSIMASLSDKDISKFLIDDKTSNIESTKKIVNALEELQKLRM